MSEMDCGDPKSNVSKANQEFVSGSSPMPAIFLSATTVKCKIGYRWFDGTSEKSISCLASGFWSSIDNCLGKANFKQKFFPNIF